MGLLSLETNHPDLAVEWIASAITEPQGRVPLELGCGTAASGSTR
jgi:hypothetical protein